ncbi:MAG: 1-acyl-sn-glycerol-3-phosphate acyltransferase [Candidatus Omnitrophica bacterium]|nr:1-acyl-sn-glycerol-3-phosphate acyltransferase [Candidatus Omnitrophota bacterium]
MRKARLLSVRLWSATAWIVILLLTIVFFLLILASRVLLWWCDPRRKTAHWLASLWGRAIFLCSLGWRIRVTGRGHIHPGRAYLLVANHQSAFDIMALYFLRRQFKWVAKEELFRIPFAGWSMALAGYIELGRGRNRSIHTAYAKAKGWLDEGMSVFFFPEGTRSITGTLGAFKNGAFKLAIEAGVPVVPIVVDGTRELLPRHSLLLRPRGHIHITVHPPIDPSAQRLTDPHRLRDEVRGLIEHTLRQSA